ncbi:MAG TPA: hypothetical protein VF252_03960 [Gemmatimonadales bacterium]
MTVVLLLPSSGRAQLSPSFRLGGHGVLAYTRADPVPGGRALGEVRLGQPTIMARVGAFANSLRLLATLNLEGLTLADGELTPGAWGEGFIDRRHPHTYAHELMLTAERRLGEAPGDLRLSLSAGKGFAPFGTDEPMSRPPLRYPVNHHLAQILERAVAIAGLRVGPVMLEAGLFNGDEPEEPGQWPRISRLGDSWSGRLTVWPLPRLEFQGSRALVHSPEHRPGSGTDQSKWSVSGRWEGGVAGAQVSSMAEWARTSEADGFFVFHSLLAEGAWAQGAQRLYYRFERTERPEEERVTPTRSRRPHLENSILGITRWTIHTVGYGFNGLPQQGTLGAVPLLELSFGRVQTVEGGLFDPASFYGKTSFWSVSAGVRLNFGTPMQRMGRYGVAQDTAVDDATHQHGAYHGH